MTPTLIAQLKLAIKRALCRMDLHKRKLIYEGAHTAYFGYPALKKCQWCGKLQRFTGIGYKDEVTND